MRSALKRILARVQTGLHPAPGVLLESIDGQLGPKENAQIKAHLARCVRCRGRLEELHEGLRFYDRCIAPKETEISVDELQKPVSAEFEHGEFVLEGREERPSLIAYARMQSELSIYVGQHAARQLLERCDRPAIRRDRLESVIQPVITELFGERTGAAVVERLARIWHRAPAATS